MKKETIKFCLILTIFITVLNLFPVTGASPDSILGNNVLKAGQYGMGLSSKVTGTTKLNLFGQPLIILDGMPYYTFSSDIINYATADLSDIANILGISEEEIESVTILTDPTELMSYGSAAKNGAIYITTKTATDTKFKINYSLKTHMSWEKPGYEMLDNNQYINYLNEAHWNTFIKDELISGVPDHYFDYFMENLMINPNYLSNTNWFNEITQTGFQQEHTLAINGRLNGLGYRLSTMFNKGTGTIINTGNTDYNFRLFLDYKVRNLLFISGGVDYINRSNNDYYKSDNVMDIRELALKMLPNMSIYEYTEEGEMTENFFLPPIPLQGSQFINPVAIATLAKNNLNKSYLNTFINLQLNISDKLFFNSRAALSNHVKKGYQFLSDLNTFEGINGSTKYDSNYNDIYLTSLNKLKYHPILSQNHSLQVVAGVDYSNFKRDYTVSLLRENDISNIRRFTSQNWENSTLNNSLHAKYTAFNKYEFQTNVNLINNSFENEYLDWSINYAFRAAWNINEENILSNLKFFNALNLSVYYANTNTPVSDYNKYIEDPFKTINSQIVHKHLVRSIYSENEQLNTFNFDLYLSVLNNRLKINADYFYYALVNEIIADGIKIYDMDLPYLVTQNSAVKGWEVNSSLNLVNTANLKFDVNVSLFNSEKIITDINYPNALNRTGSYEKEFHINDPYGIIYGYNYLGVASEGIYSTQLEKFVQPALDENGDPIYDIEGNIIPMFYSYYFNQVFEPGDARYQDQNFDGIIDDKDITVIGDSRPLVSGTFGTALTYKGLWLGTFFNFRYGNDIVNLTRRELTGMYDYTNQSQEILNMWRKSDDITNVPRALYFKKYNWLESTRFVEDGSFLRLKALTLKYSAPEHICGKLHLKSLSFYVTGKNLITWTNYKGADPDINLNVDWYNYGFDSNYAAPIKEIVFGVNIGI
ncbi:hypothetical protein ACE01N_08215 [Saccharicrinis sp. FJH2]|uniref:hypothetical protein n=1 Tax=Saccharicrinis sp. FJH65 TaxID=3344659 RepID=UPI0035F307AB